jgi:hypothetical protein
MSLRSIALAAAALLSFGAALPASAADLGPMPVKAKPIIDVPFFLVNDNRVTYSYIFAGTDPGVFSVRPDGSLNSKTQKQVYSFTHFDVWAYGTNFFTISAFKSDHNDPVANCPPGQFGNCAGTTEIYGLIRSTFGFNEIFNTRAFTVGPLRNVSLQLGADLNTQNNAVGPAKRDFVAGLQFAFDLPYKGFFNIAPLYYKEINHNAFLQCGPGGVPGVTCLSDGNTNFNGTWAVEMNYYMDLGFLPPAIDYFSISGRAGFYGKKGSESSPLAGTSTAVEINSEPIRLTFDASKAIWGAKYSHNVDVWVAYRYWKNKFGLDAGASAVCRLAGGAGASNGTCTEESLYSGVTVKF